MTQPQELEEIVDLGYWSITENHAKVIRGSMERGELDEPKPSRGEDGDPSQTRLGFGRREKGVSKMETS
jgi:hypothetical protein